MLSASTTVKHLIKLVFAMLIIISAISLAVQSVWRLTRPGAQLAGDAKLKQIATNDPPTQAL